MAGAARGRHKIPSPRGNTPNSSETTSKENMRSKSSGRYSGSSEKPPGSSGKPPDSLLPDSLLLAALLGARLASALWAPISDCDETYNYWEPAHYLLYGSGMQTWEYAPQYALRSYLYVLLHAAPAALFNALVTTDRYSTYLFVRCCLAAVCFLCELHFFRGVRAAYGRWAGRVCVLLMLCGAGMFVAASAFLPSSFAMYTTYAAVGAWLRRQERLAVLCVGVGAVVGWPFAALVGVPIAADMALRRGRLSLLVGWTLLTAAVTALPMLALDSAYYGRPVLAPLRLVLYNVFTAHGPDLYGTEPPTFYLRNGLLNFSVAAPLALLALPLTALYSPRSHRVPQWLALTPLWLWLAVFTLQPHKEERFLYPAYGLVCLAAALTLERARYVCRGLAVYGMLLVYCVLGVSRCLALVNAYHAPASALLHLPPSPPSPSPLRVCVGKEWHRFPSSFHLPENYEVRFLRSEFRGQLPQPYAEGGTALLRGNFNDLNQEEEDRYVAPSTCHYLLHQATPQWTQREPPYHEDANWAAVYQAPFLDATRSPRLLRAFYVPWLTEARCAYNTYHLLRNRNTT